MAEVIGLIGSVIAIAAFVNDGVKRAKALYRASEELEALQVNATIGVRTSPSILPPGSTSLLISSLLKEQLENFTSLVNEIDIQPENSLSTAISTNLSRAKLTLEQLDQLLKAKVSRNANGTPRARRRAWTRNRSKVYKLQDALKEHRLNLLAAMSARNL